MDNVCAIHGVPNMFGKENCSQKLENTAVFRPVQHMLKIEVN
jgi:hypothetical protein